MGRSRTSPGLFKRGGVWHIDKRIGNRRVCQSTGTTQLEEAERFLARLREVQRQAAIYGVRPPRRFETAAAKFVQEHQHKRSIQRDVDNLAAVMPFIGDLTLDQVHMGTLQPWIEYRREQGRAIGTINHGLKITRQVLNLAASEWLDEYGMTWLAAAPKIRLLPDQNKRQPYPLNWAVTAGAN